MPEDSPSDRRVADAVQSVGRFAETAPFALVPEELALTQAERRGPFASLSRSVWWGSRRLLVLGPVAVLTAVTVLVVSLVAFGGGKSHTSGSTHGRVLEACSSRVVADALVGDGAVTTSYLPRGFHLQEGDPNDVGLGQSSRPLNYGSSNPWQHLSIGPHAASEPLGSETISGGNAKYKKTPISSSSRWRR